MTFETYLQIFWFRCAVYAVLYAAGAIYILWKDKH